jgi:hypothetical protein
MTKKSPYIYYTAT